MRLNMSENEAAAVMYWSCDPRVFGGRKEDCLSEILTSLMATLSHELELWKPFLFYLFKAAEKLPTVNRISWPSISKLQVSATDPWIVLNLVEGKDISRLSMVEQDTLLFSTSSLQCVRVMTPEMKYRAGVSPNYDAIQLRQQLS